MSATDELKEILEKLNLAAQDKYKYSAKITTNAKGEGQIHCSVKSNESPQEAEILLKDLLKRTIETMNAYGIQLPKVKT